MSLRATNITGGESRVALNQQMKTTVTVVASCKVRNVFFLKTNSNTKFVKLANWCQGNFVLKRKNTSVLPRQLNF